MKNISFSGKIAYIVGGSTGIGFAIAKLLTQMGSNVIIFARTKEKLQKALTDLEGQRKSPSQTLGFQQMDASKIENVRNIMDNAIKAYGVPSLLINCAGRAYPHKFEDVSFEQFDDTMKTNLYSIWNTCSVLVPHMKKNGGTIVNTSSMAGFVAVYGYTDYCASKFAVLGFSDVLRSELKAFNINVSVLCPPDTDTPGFKTENLTKPEETKAISAGAKLMTPDQVAKEVIEGIQKNRKIIVPSFDGKFTHFMKRHFPGIVDKIMKSAVLKVQNQQGK